jgi:hypothetical protein
MQGGHARLGAADLAGEVCEFLGVLAQLGMAGRGLGLRSCEGGAGGLHRGAGFGAGLRRRAAAELGEAECGGLPAGLGGGQLLRGRLLLGCGAPGGEAVQAGLGSGELGTDGGLLGGGGLGGGGLGGGLLPGQESGAPGLRGVQAAVRGQHLGLCLRPRRRGVPGAQAFGQELGLGELRLCLGHGRLGRRHLCGWGAGREPGVVRPGGCQAGLGGLQGRLSGAAGGGLPGCGELGQAGLRRLQGRLGRGQLSLNGAPQQGRRGLAGRHLQGRAPRHGGLHLRLQGAHLRLRRRLRQPRRVAGAHGVEPRGGRLRRRRCGGQFLRGHGQLSRIGAGLQAGQPVLGLCKLGLGLGHRSAQGLLEGGEIAGLHLRQGPARCGQLRLGIQQGALRGALVQLGQHLASRDLCAERDLEPAQHPLAAEGECGEAYCCHHAGSHHRVRELAADHRRRPIPAAWRARGAAGRGQARHSRAGRRPWRGAPAQQGQGGHPCPQGRQAAPGAGGRAPPG